MPQGHILRNTVRCITCSRTVKTATIVLFLFRRTGNVRTARKNDATEQVPGLVQSQEDRPKKSHFRISFAIT